jgi:hypothetical protein
MRKSRLRSVTRACSSLNPLDHSLNAVEMDSVNEWGGFQRSRPF